MQDKIKVGVVGVGKMGRLHLEKVIAVPEAQLLGFHDHNTERSKKIAQEFNTHAYESLTDLLFDADAVIVSTRTGSHYSVCRKALEMGAHVLVEKPITGDVDQASNLLSLARQKNLRLQVGFVERFRLTQMSTEFSAPCWLECTRLNTTPGRDRDSDVILDLMIHDIDIALSIIQSPPTYLRAWSTSMISKGSDVANAYVEFANGSAVTFHTSRVSAVSARNLKIHSKERLVDVDFLGNIKRVSQLADQTFDMSHETFSYPEVDALQLQCNYFIRSIQGRSFQHDNDRQAIEALQLATQIRESVEQWNEQYLTATQIRPTQTGV